MNINTGVRLTAAIVTIACGSTSFAQSNDESEVTAIEEIVVSGRVQRLPEDLSAFPGSVTVVDYAELQRMRGVVDDLGVILSNVVPSLSPSGSQTSASNFDQTLRGRKPAVFIDGVPITTPLRDGAQDIRSLHPSVIGNIQVIRGSTTLYGNGGAGGIINYVTRVPDNIDTQWLTEVSTGFSFTHFGDSAPLSLTQTVAGDAGLIDFLASGYISQIQGSFDADGDRIPPNPNVQIGLADSRILNFFGKVGLEAGNHRFETSALYYEQEQDTDFQLVNGSVADGIPTSTEPANFDPRRTDPGNTNLVINAVYTNSNLLGNTARLQAFYHDYESMFEFFPDPVFPGSGQPFVEAQKFGTKLDVTTPLNISRLDSGNIIWGLDYWEDQTAQPLTDGRAFVPDVTQNTLAVFAQAELPITDNWTVMGGVRHEDIDVDVVDYIALFSGAAVTGGKITYNETTYNIGAVFSVTDTLDVFGSVSQGVSVAEIGRILRQATEDIDVASIDLEASVTDSYELGVRFNFDRLALSATFYRNESDLGTNVAQVPGTEQFIILLQPEEINGFELTAEYDPTDDLRIGASYSTLRGETDADGDGTFDAPLTGQRIPPSKLFTYLERNMGEDWLLRFQATYTGARNKFPGSTSFGQGEVNSHLILDAYTRFGLGRGDLSIGISNLLNEKYFTHTSEISNTDNRYSRAPGAAATIRYSIGF